MRIPSWKTVCSFVVVRVTCRGQMNEEESSAIVLIGAAEEFPMSWYNAGTIGTPQTKSRNFSKCKIKNFHTLKSQILKKTRLNLTDCLWRGNLMSIFKLKWKRSQANLSWTENPSTYLTFHTVRSISKRQFAFFIIYRPEKLKC